MEVMPSIWRYIETPNYKKVIKALHGMTKYVNDYMPSFYLRKTNNFKNTFSIITELIDAAIAEFEKSGTKANTEESVLQKLLKIDKKVAIVMALDMMMAGVDTVKDTLHLNIFFRVSN